MGNHQRLETSLNGLGRCGCASKIPAQMYLLDDKELQCFVLLCISGLSVMVGQVNPIFSFPMGCHSYSNGHIYDQGIYFTGKSMSCLLYHLPLNSCKVYVCSCVLFTFWLAQHTDICSSPKTLLVNLGRPLRFCKHFKVLCIWIVSNLTKVSKFTAKHFWHLILVIWNPYFLKIKVTQSIQSTFLNLRIYKLWFNCGM